MKQHLAENEQENIKFNLYKTDEHHWTLLGGIKPDKSTSLIGIIIKQDSGTNQTYNIDPTNLSQFTNKNNFFEDKSDEYCIICGKYTTNLIYHKHHPTHHYHTSCHEQLIHKLKEMINNNSTLLTAREI